MRLAFVDSVGLWGELADHGQEAVVGLDLADGDPHPLLAIGTHREVDPFTGGKEIGRAIAEPKPHEVRLARRHAPALIGQRRFDPRTLDDECVDAS